MNLVRKIGQMLVYGWGGELPEESRSINRHARALIDEFHVGGIVLMGRNVEGNSPERMHAIVDEFQAMSTATEMPPLLVAVDQEGGRVARFAPPHFRTYPSAATLGEAADEAAVRRNGRAIGTELSSVGVNWVLAPVLDVNNNPANTVIGDRSYGSDPDLVARLGVAALKGLQDEAGLLACGKHFPGHGDTETDSHRSLPVIRHGRERLDAIELKPFRAAIDAGIGSIMSSHILFPDLDPEYPATLSPKILNGLLREELGFDGLIVTDDMEMKGLASWSPAEAAVRAVIAGADMLLVCHTYRTQRAIIDALVDAATSGRLSEERIDEANRRIALAKKRWVVAD
ncbi:MAG: beta-N-acetylhexosaminidase [Capsulimonadaceae bacterium]|nr:beta-N-acetylhexosaminidase [Capsulimonadaceae bacterium]